jgi:shikimate dehydrogenase
VSPEPAADEVRAGLPLPLSGRTRIFAILGDPIAQAGSPALFNAEFRRRGLPCVLVPMHVRPRDLEAAFRGLWTIGNLDGLVLTVPHKIDALRLVDEVGPAAERMGAVNAVRRLPDGRLTGENFDGAGFIGGMRARGHALAGRRVLIVGCGGAGSAIASAIAAEGPRTLRLYDVDGDRAEALAARIRAWSPTQDVAAGPREPVGMDVVVNCTSLGMTERDELPVDVGRLEPSALTVDIVLKPEITPFLAQASAKGHATHSGSHMLAAQVGAICDFFGLGEPVPLP